MEHKEYERNGKMNEEKDFLGTEPVGRLLFRLAVPTVTAQLINMLYNIVELRMMQKGNVSQAVETLVKKNLVKRRQDVEDRRKIHLSLTEESEAIVRTVEEVNRRFQATVFDGIAQEEMETFSAINLRIMQNAQRALGRKE